MTRFRSRLHPLACIVALGLAPALGQAGTLRDCRAISDPKARLACYDALPVETAATVAAPAPVTAPTAAQAATAKAPAAPAPSAEQRFGMSTPAKDGIGVIESHIEGRFEGWDPKTLFRLANGQVWQVSDNSEVYYLLQNPKVKVRRGLIGGFFLEIEGLNASPRVRRIR